MPTWRRIQSKLNASKDARSTIQNSAGREGSNGQILNIATAVVDGCQVISYSGFGMDMCYSNSKGPIEEKVWVGSHLILDNINQFQWKTATLDTIQALAKECGANLTLYNCQYIYACRLRKAHDSKTDRAGMLRSGKEYTVRATQSHQESQSVDKAHGNMKDDTCLLSLGHYREGDDAPQFCFAGTSSDPTLEPNSAFELLCYKEVHRQL